ncbi:peptidylprolyl isomerase [Candidatus Nitrosotenuis uzonensis]|uniref:Peptidyl-prolyl cis-trans isomerase n=1 Tax=Candidatus Nitrosotenuis uzonensis TaxID=1407055 RepID=V6AVQ0_9ARCH|nr:peptidylprolyl isomerase [Candidatus Nitrosotenuis uzonensis]CAE6489393.1 Peptidyl-prolyl cis-trans isomerase [Candidatus Nitrosotenuis uzonensis]CDI06655.1 putative FKBP-type peptidyl-prolyl cis-trans isomerase [Candidatus Nitrosotenuis uzonensis]
MTLAKGSLILIDYTAKVKDTNEVFETTIADDAKKHSIFEANVKYQPKLVSVGESWVIKGLDEALANAKPGDKITVDVTPEKGFGERDPGKVRMIPLRKLGEDAEKVSVGDVIEVDQRTGIVRFIGSGRVQVDFNHRFAGKTIVYDVNVLKSLETNEDKISAILKRHMPVEDSKIVSKLNGNILDVTIPEEIFGAEGLRIIKHFIQTDIFKFIPTLEKINFIESYSNKKVEKPAQPTENKS